MANAKGSYADPSWWKEAIVYQVYPSSFQSHPGNKTGWGSIKGITSRLDYLKSLGVNVVWSSPFFKSPQADKGYDIADYKDIDPCYGTLADVDELLAELKKREMHLLVDLVVNHTSNQHPWFLESASSKDNPKRDWYIWKPAKHINPDGTPEPPNNWGQILGEAKSVWQWDEATQEFYLAIFTPEQPDLNWENPAVRTAVWDVMNFWLDRGASGFRLDVINHISKDQAFPDAPPILGPSHKYHPGRDSYVNGPRQHELLEEMKREVLSKHEFSMTVGEMPDVFDPDEIIRTVGANGTLDMVFIFDVADIDRAGVRFDLKPFTPREIKQIQSHWQRTMIDRGGWNAMYLENHDQPRSVSRFGDDSDKWRDKSAQMLAMMQTTLGGTLFVYQGEEIGMRNAPAEWPIENFKDVETVNYWAKLKAMYGDKQPEKLEEGRDFIHRKARDHARTPMQWSSGPNAGFCDEGVEPWMPLVPDYASVNAEVQMKGNDTGSLTTWEFWQRALNHRRKYKDVYVYGGFQELNPEDESVFAYLRTSSTGEQWLVVLNMTGKVKEWAMPDDVRVGSWEHGNYCRGVPDVPVSGSLELREWEALLGKVRRD